MDQQVKPDVHRLRLRLKLRKARIEAQLTQRQAAEDLGFSLSKLIRIETGHVRVSQTDLKALLDLYNLDDPETVEDLVQTGRAAGRQDLGKYRDVLNPEFMQYLAYEGVASRVRSFQPRVVHGLLQTREYALATGRHFAVPGTPLATVKRMLEPRFARQEMVADQRMQLHFIFDEAVIRRWVGTRPGDPGIMRRQLKHLKELADRPNVTIQIVLFEHGLHFGMRGPFTLLQLDGEELLYQEGVKGESIARDNTAKVEYYDRAFAELASIASKPEDAGTVIDDVLKHMRARP